jgi:proline iminopeptidase
MARSLRRVVGALLVLGAVPAGVTGALIGLLLGAATGQRAAALVAGVVGLVVGVGGLAWAGARLLADRPRTRRWLGAAVAAVGATLVTLPLWALLITPAPGTAFPSRGDVRYWDLPTGSRLAYFHTPAATDRRPEPVVLVHGGPGAPGEPRDTLRRELASGGFDAYEYHQIGAGLSARLADARQYTVRRHVADLEAIRVAIAADRIMLVGTSWGGKLIASYLAAHPDRVARAVIDSPNELWTSGIARDARLTPEGRRDQEAVLDRYPRVTMAAAMTRLVGPRVVRTLFPDAQTDGVYESLVADLDLSPGCPGAAVRTDEHPRGFGFWANAATTWDAERALDARPGLRANPTPVLVLRAECDYISWEVTREYRDVLPKATLVTIEGSGHGVANHRPDIHGGLVVAFLLGQPLGRPAYTGSGPPF